MEASPFSAILGEFLARVPGAIAAALVDSGGETVDYAGKHDIFELKVFAAHFRILLGEASALTAGAEVTRLMVRGRKRAVLALRAPDGYAVVVVLRRRAGFAPQETSVRVLMEALAAEAGWASVEPSGWAEGSVRRGGRGRPVVGLHLERESPHQLEFAHPARGVERKDFLLAGVAQHHQDGFRLAGIDHPGTCRRSLDGALELGVELGCRGKRQGDGRKRQLVGRQVGAAAQLEAAGAQEPDQQQDKGQFGEAHHGLPGRQSCLYDDIDQAAGNDDDLLRRFAFHELLRGFRR